MKLKQLLVPAKDKRTQLVRMLRGEGMQVATRGMETTVQITVGQEQMFQRYCNQILGGKVKVILFTDDDLLKRFRNAIAVVGIATEWDTKGIAVVRYLQHQKRIVMDVHHRLCPNLIISDELIIKSDGYEEPGLAKG